jgi:hypothetical protein
VNGYVRRVWRRVVAVAASRGRGAYEAGTRCCCLASLEHRHRHLRSTLIRCQCHQSLNTSIAVSRRSDSKNCSRANVREACKAARCCVPPRRRLHMLLRSTRDSYWSCLKVLQTSPLESIVCDYKFISIFLFLVAR